VARRGGLFSRIVKAVRDVFTREEPTRRAPAPTPPKRDKRPPDPYLFWWRRNAHRSTGYLQHKDILDDMALEYDLDADEKLELWQDYTHYMVSRDSHYRRNDVRNLFWQNWGIDPRSFDWQAWREAMGDSPRK
jgi:hypothetical protein